MVRINKLTYMLCKYCNKTTIALFIDFSKKCLVNNLKYKSFNDCNLYNHDNTRETHVIGLDDPIGG